MSTCATITKPGFAAIIPAAGRSQRMGRFKPLLPLAGGCVIERVVQLFKVSGVGQIILVLGHRADDVGRAVAPLGVRCIENFDYPAGMFTSVLAGIRALSSDCQAFFMHPADIPLVRPATVQRLMAAFEHAPATVLFPTFEGRRGHPTLIRSLLAPEILRWRKHGGLRRFLQNHARDSIELPVADEAVLMDLDTPEDYSRLQTKLKDADLPSAKECRELMHRIKALPFQVEAHCRAVAAVAHRLAQALNAAGFHLHVEQIRKAALLHDICRTDKHHARSGGRFLEIHGFAPLAPLVESHMDLNVKPGQSINESQIVFLADKLVIGDQRVDLEERFARKLEKYGQNPVAADRIVRIRQSARRVKTTVERITGLNLEVTLGSARSLWKEDPFR